MTDFSIKKQLDEWCLESIFDILPLLDALL